MAYIFGDSFDCYATTNDPVAGYWDGGNVNVTNTCVLSVGRFTGGQALANGPGGGLGIWLYKNSGNNDAVHHIVCAFQQTATLTGTFASIYLQLCDGATGQCCIVFRTDGAVLLTSGGPAGTTLATYASAVTAQNTWFAFEFEVVIHPSAGSFTARKNGNPSNDFTLGSLNTRGGTANNYANRLQVGDNWGGGTTNASKIDDILWRSDASSVPFVGDVRCYMRTPASDASVQFARSLASTVQTPLAANFAPAPTVTFSYYTPFTAAFDGTVSTTSVSVSTGYTGNLKCSAFNSTGTAPSTVRSSATTLVNPVTGANTIIFPTPFTVTRGTQYWLGFATDAATGAFNSNSSGAGGNSSTTGYSAFPAASPVVASGVCFVCSWTLTINSNAALVNETLQDGITSYVFDSTVGHADLYNIAGIAATPASTVAVVTRAFVEKLDAGFRQVTVQTKSGATTVQATPQALANNFGWIYRADTVDPATGAAWTPAAINSLQVGPLITG